jgi:hypothetical protein
MDLIDAIDKGRYIVMRNDKPITDEELTLEEAKKELERWKNILKRWPDGTKVRLEPVIK